MRLCLGCWQASPHQAKMGKQRVSGCLCADTELPSTVAALLCVQGAPRYCLCSRSRDVLIPFTRQDTDTLRGYRTRPKSRSQQAAPQEIQHSPVSPCWGSEEGGWGCAWSSHPEAPSKVISLMCLQVGKLRLAAGTHPGLHRAAPGPERGCPHQSNTIGKASRQ